MNNHAAKLFRISLFFLLVGGLILSCSLPQAALPSRETSTARNPSTTPGDSGGQTPPSTGIPTPVPGPLDWLLRPLSENRAEHHLPGRQYIQRINRDR